MATTCAPNFRGTSITIQDAAVTIGGLFSAVASVLSLLLIRQHLKSYTNPQEQKWIIGVLFMVPVYATESIISLVSPRLSTPCDILRNCYEAFALYSFGSYLIACLGGEERVIEFLEDEASEQLTSPLLGSVKDGTHRSSFFNFFLRPNVLGEELYTIEKFGLVQYMILKTLCSFLALVLQSFGVYGDGEFKWYNGYPYIAAILNFSQMWALYCLVTFYKVTHKKLEPIRPLAKFISFKAIVFATWWQGVGIALLCYFGVLPKQGRFQNELQDFLICIEMAMASVAHIFVFPAEPYRFLSVCEYGKVIAKATKSLSAKLEEGCGREPALVERTKSRVEAPGTSVTESVQDVVLRGGEHVVKDVMLTISQAMEPVEKGVTRIHETFHQISKGSDKNQVGNKHAYEEITESGQHVMKSEH